MLTTLTAADLRALRVFRTISEFGSFAGAERELDVTQSTISTQLSALERRLGFRLCERGPGGFHLTERGRTILNAHHRLDGAIEEFTQTAADLSERVAGTLRLGLMDHISTDPEYSTIRLIRTFHERAPDVHLEISESIQSELAEGVLAKSLDLAIGAFPVDDRRFDAFPLYSERQYIYCGPMHPLFQEGPASVSAETLEAAAWVRRSYALEPLGGFPLEPRRAAATATNLEAVTVILSALPTLGYLPHHVASPLVDRGELRLVTQEFAITYQVSLLSRAGRRDSAAMKRFRALSANSARLHD